MNCPNCGLPAGENDKFCIGCGARLAAPVPPAEVELPKPEEIPEAVENAVPEVEEVKAEVTKAAEEVNEVLEAPSPVVQPAPEPVPAAVPVIETPAPKPEASVNAAPVVVEHTDEAEPAQKPGKLSKPLSVWGYFWRILLFSLPIVLLLIFLSQSCYFYDNISFVLCGIFRLHPHLYFSGYFCIIFPDSKKEARSV